MFRAILETQWKWTRGFALVASLVGFALPLASLQFAHRADTPMEFVARMQLFGAFYAVLAAAVGLIWAFLAWNHDHRGRHVYALSLPITRARYVAMRLGAGATFLGAPTLAVLLGCLVVAAFGGIPTGLHAYPVALTLRFAFAALVAYSIFFAIASSTPKAAGILIGLIAVVVLAQYVLMLTETRVDVAGRLLNLLFEEPGVFSVFRGRWMLVDA
jgi:hypothetical protein